MLRDRLLRPRDPEKTRILFLARHAPDEPAYAPKSYPGCGGYPRYYHKVFETLRELGYRVQTSTQCASVLTAPGNVDLVFSLYNRMPIHHPEILVSSLCEFLRLPCVGAPPNTRAVAEDKWLSKLTARAIGLPVTEGAPYDTAEALLRPPSFPGPYFVKNRYGAASEGVDEACIQDDWCGAKRIAERFLDRGMAALVEEFAPGVDVTMPILGGATPLVLGLVHSISDKKSHIVTEDLKRDDPLGYAMFEPGSEIAESFRGDAQVLWGALGPMDYLRMDYRFDSRTGRRVFLEFNLCCHIGRSGAICLAAGRLGASQADVIGHVAEFALRRHASRPNRKGWVL